MLAYSFNGHLLNTTGQELNWTQVIQRQEVPPAKNSKVTGCIIKKSCAIRFSGKLKEWSFWRTPNTVEPKALKLFLNVL